MKVQIVIPCINLWNKYTKPCIDSVVKACEGLDHRILLIDNCSTDETLVEAGKLVSSTFSHYRAPVRMSFSESVNFGVNDAFERGYEYVLVLNNDVLLRKDTIKFLLERFIDSQEVVMVSCLNVRGEVEPLNIESVTKDCDESEHPDFSGFMINKECWDKVGEFDVGFYPAYFEDNDYHHRIKIAGLKAICYPQAIYYHFGSATTNEAFGPGKKAVTGTDFEKCRAYYNKKWGGLPGSETYKTPFNK